MRRKTIESIFPAINKQNLTQENLDIAKKGKSSGKNRISFNSRIKHRHRDPAKIDKTPQDSRYRLCCDRDETVITFKVNAVN